MALWKPVALPAGTLRTQLEPVVNVGQVEVPWTGKARLTVFCGSVGKATVCARKLPEPTKSKKTSVDTLFIRTPSP